MRRSGRSRAARLLCATLVLGVFSLALPRCSNQYALLLTIQGTSRAEIFDLKVKQISNGRLVLERVGEQVEPGNPERDISQAEQALKIAIEFDHADNYLVYVRARGTADGGSLQFALRNFDVTEVRQVALLLQPLIEDGDHDGIPACGAAGIDCQTVACPFLDCDDQDDAVHPFAKEICGNGRDEDCSILCGGRPDLGDGECVDGDGDGAPQGPLDCDDDDPCRATTLVERADRCDQSALPPLPEACLARLAREGITSTPPHCGDGIDQDCNGQDIACRIDEDCDGVSPPDDCDDEDSAINPAAEEICDGRDNNCINGIDEGCVPCDVDGDLHALPGSASYDCTDAQGNPLPLDDIDDFDAGRHPGVTADTGDSEGGTVLTALMEFCGYALDKSGQRHRDVDHDGDGMPARADGCPSEQCDRDGDGFEGAQCSPPAARLDCDDNDPHAFPGAPDRCDDGISQNCRSDRPCLEIVDRDGDRYAAEEDCDDSRADRAPWASEKCDGVDNDCDRLIDEGNPDTEGNPIPVGDSHRLCNDNNEGHCGGGGPSAQQICSPGSDNCSASGRRLSGTCACSRAQPKGVRDEGNRTACPGERLDAPSPRCFGATQPQVEVCDTEDWDCDGRPDDPAGDRPFVGKNTACGTDRGNCRSGTVVGCDLGQTIPDLQLVRQTLGSAFNPYFVCAGALLPTWEACNGKDDDCDGQLPPGERDLDRDEFLACDPPCNAGDGRLDLRSGLRGCDDCNDGNDDVFPGARELCNDRDDNCAAGTSDDGADQCTRGETCCSEQPACRDLTSDMLNCGRCDQACNPRTADRCTDGSCACGSGPPCGTGLNCLGGSCRCLDREDHPDGRCDGCCAGDTCLGGDQPESCGRAGAACKRCIDDLECTADLCQSDGSCSNPPASSDTSCNDGAGHCLGPTCCEDCISGDSCIVGDTLAICGSGGIPCAPCAAPGDCWTADCSTRTCVTAERSGPCDDGQGECIGGSCVPRDAGPPPDSAPPDSGAPDAGVVDAGAADAATSDAP